MAKSTHPGDPPTLKSAHGLALTDSLRNPPKLGGAEIHFGEKTVPETIAEQANAVRQAAGGLTDRIVEFQSYLGSLPGRVETALSVPHPGFSGMADMCSHLYIKLHREGKQWILSYGETSGLNILGGSPDFKPLVDAPLKIKIAAVKHFPSLLLGIEKSQAELIAEITVAASEYDQFIKTLPPIKTEGK